MKKAIIIGTMIVNVTAIMLMLTTLEAEAVRNYTITVLGTLPGYEAGSSVHAINDRGEIVGKSTKFAPPIYPGHAFLYSDGIMYDLNNLIPENSGWVLYDACDINNSGQIVGLGLSPDGQKSGFLYSDGQIHNLGRYMCGGSTAFPTSYKINDSGQVVGQCLGQGLLYSDGNLYEVPTESEEMFGFMNYAINNSGQIAGEMWTRYPPGYDSAHPAFLYTPPGQIRDLGALEGGDVRPHAEGYGINNLGHVVGISETGHASYRPFWYDGTKMKNLGSLGGNYSRANSINDLGEIVGRSRTASYDDHAFVYVDGEMHDLNDLIPEASNWVVSHAYDINNRGQIVGTGYDKMNGQDLSYLLTPIGEPVCMTVGNIKICADSFLQISEDKTKALGSVKIGDYLTVSDDGFVIIDGVKVTGEGIISLLVSGEKRELFDGKFSVNITTGEVKPDDIGRSLLESIAGFVDPVVSSISANAINGTATAKAKIDLAIPYVTLLPSQDSVAQQTNALVDDVASVAEIIIDVEYTISHDGKSSGKFGEFSISFGGLNFKMKDGTISEAGIHVKSAKLELPESLGGLKTEVSGINISSKEPYIELESAKIDLPEIRLGKDKRKPIFKISASVSLGFDQKTGFWFAGEGSLETATPKTKFDAKISIQAASPYLREAKLSIRTSKIGVPVGTTGAFLIGGSGGIKIVPDFELSASVDIGWGLYLPSVGYPLVGTPGFIFKQKEDTQGEKDEVSVEINGKLEMYEFIKLDGSIVYSTVGDFKGGLKISIDLILIKVDGNMKIHIWKDKEDNQVHFSGGLIVSAYVPKGAIFWALPPRDIQLEKRKMLFGEFYYAGKKIYGIKASVELLGIEVAIFIDKDGNVEWGRNLESIILVDQKNIGSISAKAMGVLAHTQAVDYIPVSIGSGNASLIFGTKWETGDLSFSLIKPDGTEVTPETSELDELITFTQDGNAQTYIVSMPDVGEWKVKLDEIDGDENYQVRVLKARPSPSIDLSGGLSNPSTTSSVAGSLTHTISWNSNDPDDISTISLYYDDDNDGTDGTPIVTGLDSSVNSYEWDTSFVPSGHYYIYGIIDDGKNMPYISYSSGATEIVNDEPPSTPVGLSITPSQQSLEVKWDANTELDLATYNVYHKLESDTDWLIDNAELATSYRLTNLMNGENYDIALSATDTSGNESPLTEVLTASPDADADILPPVPPTGFAAQMIDEMIALSWSSNSEDDIAGYNLYYGYSQEPPFLGSDAQQGISPISLGLANNFQLTGLTSGIRYYFALAARDIYGNESDLSQVISVNFIAETDSDNDTFPDDWEMAYLGSIDVINSTEEDYDSDGLNNGDEFSMGTNPANPDTDSDRVMDGDDPNPNAKIDADGDFMPDDWEEFHEVSEPGEDKDGEYVTNLAEYVWDTNPSLPDTDGDNATDFQEIQAGTDPNDDQDIPMTQEIQLYKGWNLISTCMNTRISNIAFALAPINGDYTHVYAYNGLQKIWACYMPEFPFSELSDFEAGKGYWIHMQKDATLSIAGDSIVESSIMLYEGWNLVGYNSLDDIPMEQALSSIANKYDFASVYDAQSNAWKVSSNGLPDYLNSLESFKSGNGVWINVNSDCEWAIP